MEIKLIKRNGKVSMDRSFDYLCSLLTNGEYTLSIKRKTRRRTIPQNALMWMWFTCMADSTGQCKEDFHDYYALKFLPERKRVNGREFLTPGKTSSLNTIQMTDFLNKVQADAATEFGIILPLPGDIHFQTFVDHYRQR